MLVVMMSGVPAIAGEIVKCRAVDLPRVGNGPETRFSVDVSQNQVDVALAAFPAAEGYQFTVNVNKRALDQNYILDANLVKKGVRTIFSQAMGKTLPLTLQLGNLNERKDIASFVTLTCGID